MSQDVPAAMRALKESFRRTFALLPHQERPRSIFLIGSTAEGQVSSTNWYQDVDIHLFFDRALITLDQLVFVRRGLSEISARFSNEGAYVGWELRDRHWKLVPERSAGLNLSIHATLINTFDYQRRILHNPVLGWNMYRLCEVLAGDHPGRILSPRPPTPLEHFHSVGGIGWMIENLYRALWLHFTDPNRQEFFPYLAGYCWNVASSVSIQYYMMLNESAPVSRKHALEFALGSEHLPRAARDAFAHVYEARYETALSDNDLRDIVNAMARAIRFMTQMAADATKVSVPHPRRGTSWLRQFSRDYNESLSAPFGRSVRLREAHYWIQHDDDLYESFAQCVQKVRAQCANPTSLELYEALSWLVESREDNLTKIYFWSHLNLARLLWSDDFDRSRGYPTVNGSLWGWEHGSQALLQRLNETFVMRGPSEEVDTLARAARAVARHFFKNTSLPAESISGQDIVACMRDLASWMGHSLITEAHPSPGMDRGIVPAS